MHSIIFILKICLLRKNHWLLTHDFYRFFFKFNSVKNVNFYFDEKIMWVLIVQHKVQHKFLFWQQKKICFENWWSQSERQHFELDFSKLIKWDCFYLSAEPKFDEDSSFQNSLLDILSNFVAEVRFQHPIFIHHLFTSDKW